MPSVNEDKGNVYVYNGIFSFQKRRKSGRGTMWMNPKEIMLGGNKLVTGQVHDSTYTQYLITEA